MRTGAKARSRLALHSETKLAKSEPLPPDDADEDLPVQGVPVEDPLMAKVADNSQGVAGMDRAETSGLELLVDAEGLDREDGHDSSEKYTRYTVVSSCTL